MAKIGLLHPVYVPISSETHGQAITYGSAAALDPMISANIMFSRSNTPLYGDDYAVENDNGITGGTISLNLTDITSAQQAGLLGTVLSSSVYYEKDAPAPYVGFGYVRVKERTSGGTTSTSYIGFWLPKVQFSLNSDEAKTKAGTKDWQTPTLEGQIMGVQLDGTGVQTFRYFREYTTQAEATAWVDAIAGLSLSQTATPVANPTAGAVADESTVTITCATSGATIYYTNDGSTPTTGSMVYSSPLVISYAVTIKAIAAKAGYTNSEIMSEAYTISA